MATAFSTPVLTSSAVQLVEGCDAAGILVLRKGQTSTLSPTEQFVEDCDRLHEYLKEGPSLRRCPKRGTGLSHP